MIFEYIFRTFFALLAIYLIAYPFAMIYAAYHKVKGAERESSSNIPEA